MLFVHQKLRTIIKWILIFSPSFSFATCIGINCSCSITANPLSFGSYLPLSGNTSSTSNSLSVTCSVLAFNLNVSYVISLNKGASATFSPRTMKHSSSSLNYNIYTNSTHTTIWGDGTPGTSTVIDSYNVAVTSVTRNYTMYGLIPASQNLPPATYSDTITATVSF